MTETFLDILKAQFNLGIASSGWPHRSRRGHIRQRLSFPETSFLSFRHKNVYGKLKTKGGGLGSKKTVCVSIPRKMILVLFSLRLSKRQKRFEEMPQSHSRAFIKRCKSPFSSLFLFKFNAKLWINWFSNVIPHPPESLCLRVFKNIDQIRMLAKDLQK